MSFSYTLREMKVALLAIFLISLGATGIICMRQQIAKNVRYSNALEDRLGLIQRKMACLVVQIAHVESPSYVCTQVAQSMAAPQDSQIIEVQDDRDYGRKIPYYVRYALAISQKSLKRDRVD